MQFESNSTPGLNSKDILAHREKLKRAKYPFPGTVNLLIKQELLKLNPECTKFSERLLTYQQTEAATFWIFYYFQTIARCSEESLIELCDVLINRKEIFTIDTHKPINKSLLNSIVLTVKWFKLNELNITQKQFIIQALSVHAAEIMKATEFYKQKERK